jgi:hypothetical protein
MRETPNAALANAIFRAGGSAPAHEDDGTGRGVAADTIARSSAGTEQSHYGARSSSPAGSLVRLEKEHSQEIQDEKNLQQYDSCRKCLYPHLCSMGGRPIQFDYQASVYKLKKYDHH